TARAGSRRPSPAGADAARAAPAGGVRAGADRDPGGRRVMTLSTSAAPVRRALLIAGCALILLLALPSSAAAHASWETSTPRWGAVLATGPRAITLLYDEDVVPRSARVAVITPRGQDLAGPPQVAGRELLVALRPG